jgi:hypothetical protein
VHSEAYKRAMVRLEDAVEDEERYRKEMILNSKLQDQAEKQEKHLKAALQQHHGLVLKQ